MRDPLTGLGRGVLGEAGFSDQVGLTLIPAFGSGPGTANIGAAAGFGNTKRANRVTGQGWSDVAVDELLIGRSDDVRARNQCGEDSCLKSRCSTCDVQFLDDGHQRSKSGALTADGAREIDTQ